MDSDMELSKALHEGEVAKLCEEHARVDNVVARQNTMKGESDALIEMLKVEFAKVAEVWVNLEQRAAGVLQEQSASIMTTFEDLRNRFAGTYDQQQAENAKVQTQLAQVEKLLKEAAGFRGSKNVEGAEDP